MNWGKWIIVAFVLFVAFIATLVTVCMRQDVDLVSKDYYKEELEYQEQIVRIANTNQLESKPVIQRTQEYLEVNFIQFKEIERGHIQLFNPSDPKKDKTFILKPSDTGKQIFAINDVAKGMYRARMQWLMNGKEYYLETIVNI